MTGAHLCELYELIILNNMRILQSHVNDIVGKHYMKHRAIWDVGSTPGMSGANTASRSGNANTCHNP